MKPIKLTESHLNRIIKEAVNMVINENDDLERDYIVKKKALEALHNANFNNIFGDNGYLSFKVSINSQDDINVIRRILTNAVKPKEFDDLRVKLGWGMANFCIVSLPAWTHSNLFQN